MHHAFKLLDAEHNVELSRTADGYRLHIGERSMPIKLQRSADGSYLLSTGGLDERISIAASGDDVFIHLGGEAYHLHYEHPLEWLAHQAHGGAEDHVLAPMPGSLVVLHVKTGQQVTRGEALLVMESMKMETTIAAPRDGVVAAMHFAKGQTFDRDAVLLTLEPVGAGPARDTEPESRAEPVLSLSKERAPTKKSNV